MKRVIYSILITLLFIPVLVCASTFNNSESLAKRYIKNFLYPERYMKVDSGDFISREEVEKTMVRKDSDNRLLTVSSYMYDGTKFWAKNRYVIAEKIEQRPQDENYKTKVTELILHGTKVKGTGKFTDPWIFVDSFKVTVSTVANGTIDGQQKVTKNVNSNGTVSFTIEPNSGYKYLNNDCGGNSEVAGNILTIRNIEKDIVCSVNFEVSKYSNTLPVPYKTVHINLTNSNVTYRFDTPSPSPNTFSAIYLQGYYTDDTLKTRIGKLTNIPSRKGWTFNGYYVKRSNYSKLDEIASTDELLINNKGFFETTYGLLKDNTTKEVIGFSIEPNKYKITFNRAGGSGGTSEVVNWPYEHDMPVITIPGRPGYVFAGYYTSTNGGGEKYYNENGTASRIFNPSTLGTLTLYAKWEECGTGKYCPGDNVKHECPNGYKDTATTTSTKCSDCRFWDICFTGENTCRYGCSTCSYNYSYACGSYVCGYTGGNPICSYVFNQGDVCWGMTDLYPVYCTSYCTGTSYYDCNCSSCYYGHNTCKADWSYNTTCSVGTTYTVNLNKKDGTGGDSSFTITYFGDKPKVNVDSVALPTKAGYVFDGYYTKENGAGKKIVDITNNTTGFVSEPNIKAHQTPSGTTFTLYANWTKCAKGSYCPGDNTSKLCAKGMYQDEEGKTSCKDCAAGTYSNIEGIINCLKCEKGTYQDKTKQTSCISCAGGTYQDEEGKASCKTCVGGSYSNAGMDKCIACNDGKTTTAHGKDNCDANCSNNANVNQWELATWNSDDTVTNSCTIKSCKTGYRLENNTCVLNNVDVVILAYPGGTVQVDGGTTYDIGSNAKSGTVSLSIGSHTFKDSHTGATKTISVSADTTQVVVGYYIGSVFGDLQLGTLRNNGERYDEPKTSSEYTIPSGNYTKMQIYAKAYILQYLYGTRSSGYYVYAPNASASFAITSTLTSGNLTTCSASLGWANVTLGPSNTNLNRVSSDCSLNKTVNFSSTGGKIKFTFKSYDLAQSAQTAYGNDIARRFKILAKSRNLSVVYIY